MIGRRDLLVRTGLLLASAGVSTLASAQPRRTLAAEDWGALRDQFDLTRDLVHMGGLYIASHPLPVRDAIERHRRAMDADPVGYLQGTGPRLESAVLRSAARYLSVGPTDVALTDSTTMGLALLYSGLAVRSDQEILTTAHDFISTHEPLEQKAARTGASLRKIDLYRDPSAASADAIVGAVERALTPRTRVVAVTWVHSSTGVKLPIRRIADAVGAVNAGRDPQDRALVCVDGVHGFGVEDESMPGLNVDFFAAGCHKWLFGPRGTGFVWGHPDAWPAASPTIPTFSDDRTYGGLMTPGGFHSFEHRWALNEAFDLHMSLGKAAVQARVHELARALKEGLAGMSHVDLHTPIDATLSSGIVCFDVAGMQPRSVVSQLRARGIVATTTPYARSHARLAAGLFNTLDEVETTLRAVRALA